MANDRLIFEVVVEGKNVKVVQRDVDKLADSVERTDDARKKAGKGQDNYNKREKGIHQTNLSSAKGFSKMQQTMGGSSGLVGAYATLAANVFAATAAFNALRRASQTQQLIAGLEAIGEASGRNLKVLAETLRRATGNAISLAQAMQTASIGASASFSNSQLEELAEVARKAAVALGRDVGDATDRLIRGVAKLEPEILDELGIFVRLDDATEKYASSINKTAAELTQFERAQAFANAAIGQGNEKFKAVAGIEPAPYDKLAASLADLSETFLTIINTIAAPFISFLASSKIALAGVMMAITKGIVSQALPFLGKLGDKAKLVAAESLTTLGIIRQQGIATAAATAQGLGKMDVQVKGYEALVKSMQKGNITRAQIIEMEKLIEKSIAIRIGQQKNLKGAQLTQSQARISQLQAELAMIRKVKTAEATIGEQQEGPIMAAQAGAKFGSRSAGVLADLDDPSKGTAFERYKKGFEKQGKINKVYRRRIERSGKATQLFGKDIALIGKILPKAAAAFKSFGAVASIAVKGIFTAIPVIGQFLFVIDLLIVGIKKIWGVLAGWSSQQTELQQKVSAFNALSESYSTTLRAQAALEDNHLQKLIATGNATSELVNAVREVTKAEEAATKELGLFGQVGKAISDRVGFYFSKVGNMFGGVTLRIKLMILDIERTWHDTLLLMADSAAFGAIIKVLEFVFEGEKFGLNTEQIHKDRKLVVEELKALELEAEEHLTWDQMNKIGDAVAGAEGFQAMQSILETGGVAADSLRGYLGEAGNSVNDLGLAFANMKYGAVTQAFGEEAQTLIKNFIEKEKMMEDELIDEVEIRKIMAVVLAAGTEEIVKQGEAATALSKLYQTGSEQIDKYTNSLTATAASKEVVTLFKNMSKELQVLTGKDAVTEALSKMPDAMKRIMGATKLTGDALKGYVADLAVELDLNYKKELSSKRILASYKLQNTFIKSMTSTNKAALTQSLALDKKASELQVELTQNKIKDSRALVGLEREGEESIEEILKLTTGTAGQREYLVSLMQEEKSLASKIVGSVEAKAKADMIDNKWKKAGLAMTKKETKLTATTLKMEQIKANLKAGKAGKQTALQIRDAEIASATAALEAAEATKTFKAEELELLMTIKEQELIRTLVAKEDRTLILEHYRNVLDRATDIADQEVRGAQATLDAVKRKGRKSVGETQGREDIFAPVTAAMKSVAEQSEDVWGKKVGDKIKRNGEEIEVTQEMIEAAKPSIFKPETWQLMAGAMQPFINQMKELGPEGAAMGAAIEATFMLGEAFAVLSSDAGMGEKMMAAGNAAIAVMGAVKAMHQAKVAGIDNEIKAEKKRDGHSAASKAKLAALEKKKEKAERKAFEVNKKMQMAQTVMAGARAVVEMLGAAPIPLNFVLAGMVAAISAANLALISGTSFQGGGAGAPSAPSSLAVGDRSNSVDLAKGGNAGGEVSYLRGESGRGTSASDFRPGGFMGKRYRAFGGSAYVVGEQGPELFMPEAPGQIVSNDRAASMGAPMNVSFQVSAIDSTNMEDMLTNQRGNIISMIRDAANSHGTGFLEGVDVSTYDAASGGGV